MNFEDSNDNKNLYIIFIISNNNDIDFIFKVSKDFFNIFNDIKLFNFYIKNLLSRSFLELLLLSNFVISSKIVIKHLILLLSFFLFILYVLSFKFNNNN